MLSSDEEAVHQITAFFKKLKEMVDKAKTCQEVLEQLKDAVEKGKTAGAKGSSILAAAFGLGGLPAGMVDLMEQFLKIAECTQMITCCKNRGQAGCSGKADGCALDLAVRMAGSTSPITGVVTDKVLSEIFHEELCGEK